MPRAEKVSWAVILSQRFFKGWELNVQLSYDILKVNVKGDCRIKTLNQWLQQNDNLFIEGNKFWLKCSRLLRIYKFAYSALLNPVQTKPLYFINCYFASLMNQRSNFLPFKKQCIHPSLFNSGADKPRNSN